ncbi:MAG: hypothetical protein OEX12_01210 [Gammaproteobacteria bacterium]|nr:hypothetical protein [Gammaproteobacteria bacterium]
MTIPADALANLNGPNQSAQIYASYLKSEVLMRAEVNHVLFSPQFGDRTIAYHRGVPSDFSNVQSGVTVLLGTSAFNDDRGRLRLKSFTGVGIWGTLTFPENTVDWTKVTHVTIIHAYEMHGIKPYISEQSGVFFKDKDVLYTDQNSQRDPVAIMDGHKTGFLEGGSCVFNVDYSNSYGMVDGASIISYTTETFPSDGVTVNVSASTGVGYISFTQAGQYWVKLTVTDNFGKTQVTRRMYFVHERAPNSEHYPFTEFEITSLRGDWKGKDWEVSINGEIPSDAAPGALFVIWAETSFNGVKTIVSEENSNILFVGYLDDEKIVKRKTGKMSASRTILSPVAVMGRIPMFAVAIQDAQAPNTWWQLKDLTASRAVWHALKFHSTALETVDVEGLNSSTLPVQAIDDMAEGQLWEQLTFTERYGEFASLACNKRGILRYVFNAQYMTDDERDALPDHHTVELDDMVEKLSIVRIKETKTAYVRAAGASYSFSTRKSTPYISEAPGEIPHYRGSSKRLLERLIFQDQNHANIISGRAIAIDNNEYPRVSLTFAGNWAGWLDIDNQSRWWRINADSDTLEGRADLADVRFLLRGVDISVQNGSIKTTAHFEGEAIGPPGITVPIPGYPINAIPPEVEPDLIVSPQTLMAWESITFTSNGSTWTTLVNDIDNTGGAVDHWWPFKKESDDILDAIVWEIGEAGVIRRFDGIDPETATIDVMDTSDPPNSWGTDEAPPAGTDIDFVDIETDLWRQDRVYALGRWEKDTNLWRSYLWVTTDDGATHQWVDLWVASEGPFESLHADNIAVNQNYIIVTFQRDNVPSQGYFDCKAVVLDAETLTFVRYLDIGQQGSVFPVTVPDDPELIHFAGLISTAEFPGGSGDYQIVATTDAGAGANWTSIQTGWTECMAFTVGLLRPNGKRRYWAVKRV